MKSYDTWAASNTTRTFWLGLATADPLVPGVGAFREVFNVHRSRLHHAGASSYISLGTQFSVVSSTLVENKTARAELYPRPLLLRKAGAHFADASPEVRWINFGLRCLILPIK